MNTSARVLITGASGQLGQALVRSAPTSILKAVTRAELEIGDTDAVNQCIAAFKPDVVINAAAYTAVDKAESEGALAQRVNTIGARNLADAVSMLQSARMIHVSTDFVFDGAASVPYTTDALAKPLGVYGHTKYQGEHEVHKVLGDRALIVRTAWVYASIGKNFLLTMLRLMKERGEVRVVTDQVGSPTSANSLAKILWQCVARNDLYGIYHWTDAGVASWYDFAVAIAEEAVEIGILRAVPKIVPIATSQYPTPAKRPSYSVLDKSKSYDALKIVPVHWREELRVVLKEVASA